MRRISLANNAGIVLVDDEDYEMLRLYKWYALFTNSGNYYAYRNVVTGQRNNQKVFMHRQIMQALPENKVDHIDGNGWHNYRSNLRFGTQSQNSANRDKTSFGKNPYKGVYPDRKRWCAKITVNYVSKHLGMFDTPEEAAQAYNKAAVLYFGEFARLNKLH